MANNDMDRVVPLGQLDDFKVAEGDPDVRGWEVLASDGRKIGEVDELLVDTNAMKVRYLDVDVDDGVIGDGRDRHVLIPIGYARLERERDCVMVDGLAAADLGGLPAYDQGPLTRDFESSVRQSFSGRGTTTSAGMTGGGAGMMDTAGLHNTPGTGTGMGMTGATTGAPLSGPDTGLRSDSGRLGDNVRDGEGMRAAGYDDDRGTTGSTGSGSSSLRDTGSSRTGLDSGLGTAGGGLSAGSMPSGTAGGVVGGGNAPMSAGSSGGTFGGSGNAPMSADSTLGGNSGSTMSAGSQGPVSGMGTDRGPQGDMSHRAGGSSGLAGSDYLHNADEDFYASDAFDDSRFYSSRRGGMSGNLGGDLGGATSRPADAGGGARRDAGGMGDSMGADPDETRRLAQDASELLREDHRNRDVGGTGNL